MTENKIIRIGLFGFGCVGYGLYNVLRQSAGFRAEIKTICIKHPEKQRPVSAAIFTTNPDLILDDPDIDVVVELTDDADAAFAILQKALGKGKPVVSANKKMLAMHFEEIRNLQAETGVPVLYEAAVCASIPIIRSLDAYYDNDVLSRIEGIVNGSTNYILTRALNEGLSYAETLAQAQALGYAESNPALDVLGLDACNKLAILSAHAFGIPLQPADMLCIGIEQIGETERHYARLNGYKIKLIAQAVKHGDHQVSAIVAPQFVHPDSPLYGVDGVYNGIIAETAFADRQFFSGKGAGDLPTASAVLSDLSALASGYRYGYKKSGAKRPSGPDDELLCEVFVSGRQSFEDLIVAHFSQINELNRKGPLLSLSGFISIAKLKALHRNCPRLAIVLQRSLSEAHIQAPEPHFELTECL